MEKILAYKRTFPELFFVGSWTLVCVLLLTVFYALVVFVLWYCLVALLLLNVCGYAWRHRREVVPLERLLSLQALDSLPAMVKALWRVPDGREHPAFPVLRVAPTTTTGQQRPLPYALVTGGAMGIGKELCVRLWDMGYSLVVWDIASDKLKELSELLEDRKLYSRNRNPNIIEQHRQNLVVQVVDVSNPNQVASALSSSEVPLMDVQILILNAGVVSGRLVRESDALSAERTFSVNALHLHHVTRLFLQHMKRFADSPASYGSSLGADNDVQQQRHFQLANITVVGSIAGFGGNGRVADYNASKAAANIFTESLRSELRLPEEKAMLLRAQGKPAHFVGLWSPDAVRVTLVCPYLVDTGMFAGTRDIGLLRTLHPDYVADSILDAISHDKDYLVIPWGIQVLNVVRHALPSLVVYQLQELFGASKMMEKFAGKRRVGGVDDDFDKKFN